MLRSHANDDAKSRSRSDDTAPPADLWDGPATSIAGGPSPVHSRPDEVRLSDGMCAYLHYLVNRDLEAWSPGRRCRLKRAEAERFRGYLEKRLSAAGGGRRAA